MFGHASAGSGEDGTGLLGIQGYSMLNGERSWASLGYSMRKALLKQQQLQQTREEHFLEPF